MSTYPLVDNIFRLCHGLKIIEAKKRNSLREAYLPGSFKKVKEQKPSCVNIFPHHKNLQLLTAAHRS